MSQLETFHSVYDPFIRNIPFTHLRDQVDNLPKSMGGACDYLVQELKDALAAVRLDFDFARSTGVPTRHHALYGELDNRPAIVDPFLLFKGPVFVDRPNKKDVLPKVDAYPIVNGITARIFAKLTDGKLFTRKDTYRPDKEKRVGGFKTRFDLHAGVSETFVPHDALDETKIMGLRLLNEDSGITWVKRSVDDDAMSIATTFADRADRRVVTPDSAALFDEEVHKISERLGVQPGELLDYFEQARTNYRKALGLDN